MPSLGKPTGKITCSRKNELTKYRRQHIYPIYPDTTCLGLPYRTRPKKTPKTTPTDRHIWQSHGSCQGYESTATVPTRFGTTGLSKRRCKRYDWCLRSRYLRGQIHRARTVVWKISSLSIESGSCHPKHDPCKAYLLSIGVAFQGSMYLNHYASPMECLGMESWMASIHP